MPERLLRAIKDGLTHAPERPARYRDLERANALERTILAIVAVARAELLHHTLGLDSPPTRPSRGSARRIWAERAAESVRTSGCRLRLGERPLSRR
jgi:hypothetical protein